MLLSGILVAAVAWRSIAPPKAAKAAEPVIDEAAAERAREEASDRARAQSDAARDAEQGGRSRKALEQIRSSDNPGTLCSATMVLGRTRYQEAIPDLKVLLKNDRFTSVQICAAGALVELGDVDTALAFYVECAQGTDPDLRRAALVGFGDIGPRAASAGLAFVEAAAESPHWDSRYLAAESLDRLGPAGVPALRKLANDSEPHVRDRAVRALEGKQ